jgi:hypothetical protein
MAWWVGENTLGRELVIGNAPFNTSRPGWSIDEITRQVELTRAQPGADGNIFFSARNLLRGSSGLREALAGDAYRTRALVPELAWLNAPTPERIDARIDATAATRSTITLRWTAPDVQPQNYLLRSRTRGVWSVRILPGTAAHATIRFADSDLPPDVIAVSAVGRNGREGAAQVFSRER